MHCAAGSVTTPLLDTSSPPRADVCFRVGHDVGVGEALNLIDTSLVAAPSEGSDRAQVDGNRALCKATLAPYADDTMLTVIPRNQRRQPALHIEYYEVPPAPDLRVVIWSDRAHLPTGDRLALRIMQPSR
jgi:hypothetical protein